MLRNVAVHCPCLSSPFGHGPEGRHAQFLVKHAPGYRGVEYFEGPAPPEPRPQPARRLRPLPGRLAVPQSQRPRPSPHPHRPFSPPHLRPQGSDRNLLAPHAREHPRHYRPQGTRPHHRDRLGRHGLVRILRFRRVIHSPRARAGSAAPISAGPGRGQRRLTNGLVVDGQVSNTRRESPRVLTSLSGEPGAIQTLAAQVKRDTPKILEGKDFRNRRTRRSSPFCRPGHLSDIRLAGGALWHPTNHLLESLVEQEESRERIKSHDKRDYQ